MENNPVETAYRQSLKLRILQVATLLFHRYGIRQVKMDDIANDLKISKRTLYEIYENKEVLLFEVLSAQKAAEKKSLSEFDKPGTNVINIIIELYKLRTREFSRINPIFFEDIHRYPNLLNYVRKLHAEKACDIKAFMQRGVDEGYFLSNVNYEVVAILADAAGQAIMNNFLYKTYEIKELFRIYVLLFTRGLCTPKGVEMLDKAMAEESEN